MEMQLIQVQTSAAGANPQAAAATAAAGATAASPQGGQTFLHKLNQLVAQTQQGAGNGETAALIASGHVPLQLILAALPETDAAEMLKIVQELMDLLKQASPEELETVLDQPAWLAWVRQVELQLGMEAAVQETAPAMPHAAASAPEAGNAADGAALTAGRLLEALAAFRTLLEQSPQEPAVRQLAQQLKATVEQQIVQPAASGALVEAEESELPQKANRAVGSGVSEGQRQAVAVKAAAESGFAQFATSEGRSGETQLQQLQRLAFLKPGAPVYLSAQPQEASVAAMAVSETTAATPLESQMATMPAERLASMPGDVARSAESGGAEGKAAQPNIPAHQFAAEMSRFMVKRMTIMQSPGISEAKLKLVPEHLGQLDVKIVMMNGQVTAYFAVESLQAKELLESQLPLLRASLQQQGIQVDKLEVAQQHAAESGLFQEQRQRQPHQSEQDDSRSKRSYAQAELNFELAFDQAEQAGMWLSGSTFDASA